MQLSDIRAEAMRQLSEQSTTASYILAADHNAFINEGIKDMCIRGLVYPRTVTGTITSGFATYYFPSDFIKCVALLDASGLPLTAIAPNEQGIKFTVSGKPLWYWISQQGGVWSFTLVDTPTTAGGGDGTYTLTYNALDVPLTTDSSVPNFPPEKHHYLVKYDLVLSFVKMKQFDKATTVYIEYCKGLNIPLGELPGASNG